MEARRAVRAACALVAAVVLAGAHRPAAGAERVSAFGRYEGYSEARYDGWTRRAQYLEMADGVRLAVDVYLPTAAGAEPAEPVPVVLRFTRYHRAAVVDGRIVTPVEHDAPLRTLLAHGYALAIADARGTGASFGVHHGPFAREEQADAAEIVGWLASRSWSNGRVGMQGRSYPGTTQYLTAAAAPPGLVAVFPEMAGTSFFDFARRGGTYKSDFVNVWSGITRALDRARRGLLPAPVDDDPGGRLRDAAVSEHRRNLWAKTVGRRLTTRDGALTRGGATWSWSEASPLAQADRIDASGVAIYHLAGWLDMFTTQQALLYANLSNPQRLTIGPWTHTDGGGSNPVLLAEMLRWYDYWLKGVDNGVMREKPIHYWLREGDHTVPADPALEESDDERAARDGRAWRATRRWPPKGSRRLALYFAAGRSGTVDSPNDGALADRRPAAGPAWDDAAVEATSRVGSLSRWMIGYDAERADRPGTTFFDERTAEDVKLLTFTSGVLDRDLVVVGSPVAHVWLASSHRDGDLFVYLEEVDAAGRAHYVSEGALRASYRALAPAPWKNLGLPFHPGLESSLAKLGGEPVELVLDLLATATRFDAGHRVRVSLAGADAANHQLHPDRRGRDLPILSIYRDRDRPSRIELPVLRR